MTPLDYYQILEIPRTAHLYEVRRAFREKAKHLHPDINPDFRAHEEFKLINEAYQVLSDHKKRNVYDQRLRNGFPSQKVYYRPADTRYRAKGERYARYKTKEEANPKFEKVEKYFDFFLFFSLLAAGCFALGYGLYRLWIEPSGEINPYPAIVMGIFFTGLMIFVWNLRKKTSEDN